MSYQIDFTDNNGFYHTSHSIVIDHVHLGEHMNISLEDGPIGFIPKEIRKNVDDMTFRVSYAVLGVVTDPVVIDDPVVDAKEISGPTVYSDRKLVEFLEEHHNNVTMYFDGDEWTTAVSGRSMCHGSSLRIALSNTINHYTTLKKIAEEKRAAFEEQYKNQQQFRHRNDDWNVVFKREETGEYVADCVDTAWAMYKRLTQEDHSDGSNENDSV